MSSDLMAIVYGIAAALTWGTGDFSGGFASKRTHVLTVVMVSQLIGAICLLGVVFLIGEVIPPVTDLLFGVAAGITGVIGLLAFYRGLASSQMGLVAPITAAISAVVPIVVGLFLDGPPTLQQFIGFGVAIVAIGVISRSTDQVSVNLSRLVLPLVAGFGFASFFILIGQANQHAVFWPLLSARLIAVILLVGVGGVLRHWDSLSRGNYKIIGLAGICDTAGNTFFAFAERDGRLDIAAVLSSLYPAMTILLAWWFLHERLTCQQWFGIAAALVAIVFIVL